MEKIPVSITKCSSYQLEEVQKAVLECVECNRWSIFDY